MASADTPPTRSAGEFKGETGLIRRFRDDGDVVDAIINTNHISLLSEKFVEIEESVFSIQVLFDRFKEVQDFDPNQAPFTVITTVDSPTSKDYERKLYDGEWCLEMLGRSLLDMYERDELA